MVTDRPPVRLLALIGGLGLLSGLLLPIEALVPGQAVPALVLRAAALVQPALLLALAVWAGARLAPGLGLGAPVLAALTAGTTVQPALIRLWPATMFATLAVALTLWVYALTISPLLLTAPGAAARLAAFEPPLLTRLLYGGVVEELLIRWGLLTVLAAGAMRLGMTRSPALLTASLVSALAFAAGHLPLLGMLTADPPPLVVAGVIAGNAVPGLIFAALYVRRGLEAAMLAHGGAHLLAWLAGS